MSLNIDFINKTANGYVMNFFVIPLWAKKEKIFFTQVWSEFTFSPNSSHWVTLEAKKKQKWKPVKTPSNANGYFDGCKTITCAIVIEGFS